MKRKEAQHFFKKLKIKGMVICLPVSNHKGESLRGQNRRLDTYQQVEKSIVKYGTSVIPRDKKFICTYYSTEIISNNGVSLRNKTMADNHRLF